jgi:hypothetical protein
MTVVRHTTLYAAAAALFGTTAMAQNADDLVTRSYTPVAPYVLASERGADPEPSGPGILRQLVRTHLAVRGTDGTNHPDESEGDTTRLSPLTFFLRPLELGDWHFTIRPAGSGLGLANDVSAAAKTSMTVGYTFNF